MLLRSSSPLLHTRVALNCACRVRSTARAALICTRPCINSTACTALICASMCTPVELISHSVEKLEPLPRGGKEREEGGESGGGENGGGSSVRDDAWIEDATERAERGCQY